MFLSRCLKELFYFWEDMCNNVYITIIYKIKIKMESMWAKSYSWGCKQMWETKADACVLLKPNAG